MHYYTSNTSVLLILHPSAAQVWFQNCRARHKKHVSPNHSSAAPVSSLQSTRISPPLLDEFQYTAFAPVDTPMLTALHSYMDGMLCGISLYSIYVCIFKMHFHTS